MSDQSKTKHDLIEEIVALRKRIAELSQYESDRKQTESQREAALEALRESEYKYRRLIDNIPDIIFTIDLEGKITFVSKRAKDILGYENADVINRNIFDFIPEDDHQTAMESLHKGMKGEKIKYVQLPVTARSGEKLYFVFSFSRIYKDGVVVGAQGTGVDITDRKREEEVIRQSDEKYRTILESFQEGYFEVDLKGNFTFCNDSMYRIIGYSKEEWLGMNYRIYTDEETGKKVYQEFNNVYTTGKPSKGLDWSYIRKDGTKRYIEASIILQKDSSGKPTGFKGMVRDITKRKRVEDMLNESEKKYRLIAENTADLIAVTDMNLRFTYISPSIMRTHGFTVEEAMNMTLDQFLPPESLKYLLTLFEEEMKIEASGNADPRRIRILELEEYRKDGSIICVESSVSAQRDKENKIIGLLTVNRDITERKRVEEKLRQTLDSLRKAVGTTVQVLVSAVESRDPYTAGHQSRSANLARAIAMEIGLAPETIEGIRMAGIIHDIGKLSIPAEILSKPTKLTEIEFALIKEHSRSGYEMLKDVESPWPLAEIVYQHHERINGSGYPRNLKGDEIIMESQILAVADVVEAMASHRPYRPTLGIKAALEEIEKNKGILYDNLVAAACLKLFREKGYQLA